MARILEANIAPGFTAVYRFIDTTTGCHTSLRVIFASAHPNRVCIIRIEFNYANGIGVLILENGLPGGSTVKCSENIT